MYLEGGVLVRGFLRQRFARRECRLLLCSQSMQFVPLVTPEHSRMKLDHQRECKICNKGGGLLMIELTI